MKDDMSTVRYPVSYLLVVVSKNFCKAYAKEIQNQSTRIETSLACFDLCPREH
jgi:hypothetical protein